MTLTNTLKVVSHIRLSIGYRWIVWDDTSQMLVVYERAPYAKKTKTIIETDNEELAVAKLIEE